MASPFAKRLAKLEEQMAAKVNQPLAYLWRERDESHADACIRAGYAQADHRRVMTIGWMTAERAKVAAPLPWDVPDPGPPPDSQPPSQEPPEPQNEASRSNRPSKTAPKFDEEAESRYRLALEEREREIINEKLYDAAKAFAKSIV
jgi:hypothetical protein